jgi:hypothetical protein
VFQVKPPFILRALFRGSGFVETSFAPTSETNPFSAGGKAAADENPGWHTNSTADKDEEPGWPVRGRYFLPTTSTRESAT